MNYRTAVDVSSSIDKNNMGTIDGKDRAKTARKKEDWGVQGYYCPNNNWMFHRVKTFVSNQKKENIIELEARRKKELPAPNMYSSIQDWSTNNKGKFPKS